MFVFNTASIIWRTFFWKYLFLMFFLKIFDVIIVSSSLLVEIEKKKNRHSFHPRSRRQLMRPFSMDSIFLSYLSNSSDDFVGFVKVLSCYLSFFLSFCIILDIILVLILIGKVDDNSLWFKKDVVSKLAVVLFFQIMALLVNMCKM